MKKIATYIFLALSLVTLAACGKMRQLNLLAAQIIISLRFKVK